MRIVRSNDRHLPLSRPCRSLCDTQQVFLPSDRQRMRALLHRVDTREFELRINVLPDHGVRISHADSHGPLHIRDGNWERCR
jgi:hypothetical protein